MESQSSVIKAHSVEGPLMLSIGIGTSAVKILFFDIMGRKVDGSQFRREYTMFTSPEGAAEVAPDELLDIVWQGIDAVLANGGPLAAEIAGVREGSARGAALLAFETLKMIKDLKDIPAFIERTCYPDDQRHAVYRETVKRQQRLYEKLLKDDR